MAALLLALACAVLLLQACTAEKGVIRGAESETILFRGVTYQRMDSSGYSSSDRGMRLGTAEGNGIVMRLYAVKGDGDGQYLYALWDWEGAFYCAQP